MADHKVICADCLGPEGLATLADKSVDSVITDPPYEAEAHAKGRRQCGRRGNTLVAPTVKAISYPPITEEERSEVGRQVARVCRGWALVFCQAEALHLWKAALMAGGARHIRMGVYRKINAQPQFTGDRPGVGWEAIEIAWCGDGRPSWNGGGRVAVWEATREGRGGVGPCGAPLSAPVDGAKPLDLMEQLVGDFTDPGDLIADPFSGSGTTLVAAKRLGRRGIGWERDPRHHAIAEKRIAGTREQLRMFEVGA